jgi:hypothetical protein
LHRDRPDFALRVGEHTFGVACAEVVAQKWKRILAIRDKCFPDAVVFPPMAKPVETSRDDAEQVAIARGEQCGAPWVADMAERQWAEAHAHFIAKKVRKLRAGNYDAFARHWLLVQDEWRVPVANQHEKEQAARKCIAKIERLLDEPTFAAVYVSSGEYLLRLNPQPLVVLPIRNLWRKDRGDSPPSTIDLEQG